MFDGNEFATKEVKSHMVIYDTIKEVQLSVIVDSGAMSYIVNRETWENMNRK